VSEEKNTLGGVTPAHLMGNCEILQAKAGKSVRIGASKFKEWVTQSLKKKHYGGAGGNWGRLFENSRGTIQLFEK